MTTTTPISLVVNKILDRAPPPGLTYNTGSVARALQSIFVSDPIRLIGLSEEHRRCQSSIVANLGQVVGGTFVTGSTVVSTV